MRSVREVSIVVMVALVALAGTAGVFAPRSVIVASPGQDVDPTCAGANARHCRSAPLASLQDSAEERLAAKYAPIIYLREQTDACGREAFRPSPVEVTLGNPQVRLVSDGPDGRVVLEAPRAADLYRLRGDSTAYLDLPGNPNSAGCTYAQGFREAGAEAPAVTYAHIRREKGLLALQYWFYYYFNDWNNQHESDWEMIQLLFRADSAAEALEREPLRVAVAQHGGGEKADWNGRKLRRDGDHPIVYASAGSHATYFDPKVYLGLGERGAGLGCDDTSGRARPVPLEARLVPDTISGPDDPFAWSVFGGRWGQREPGQNNGPRGPNTTKRWTQPVTHFDESIRDVSATVPTGTTLGLNAIQAFCGVVSLSGQALDLYYRSPVATVLTAGVLAIGGAVFLVGSVRADFFRSLAGGERPPNAPLAGEPSRSAVSVYRRHRGVFLTTGLIFIPIGILSSLLSQTIELNLGDLVLSLSLFGGIPVLAALVVVNAAVAATLRTIHAGREPNVVDAYRTVWRHLRTLAWARVKALTIVVLLATTVVGLPFAVLRLVRWLFLEQAIILDGADSRTALSVSARAVRGRWWRTALFGVVLALVGALLGPALAIIALLTVRPPGEVANLISSIVYALVLPLVFIAMTQYYVGLRARR